MFLYRHCLYKISNCSFHKLKLSIFIVRNSCFHKGFKEYGSNNKILANTYVQIQWNSKYIHQKKNIGLEIREQDFLYVDKDVPLYQYENTRFFKHLTFFSVSQFIFWTYLSHVAYSTMRDNPVSPEEYKEVENSLKTNRPKLIPMWRRWNLGRYKDGLSITCAVIGFLSVVLSSVYTKNSVKLVVLKKGGENLLLEYFTILGRGRSQTIPLSHLSAKNSRQNAKGFLILQVKNRLLHIILDMKGNFPNKDLFDRTAGLRRTWKK